MFYCSTDAPSSAIIYFQASASFDKRIYNFINKNDSRRDAIHRVS